MISYTPPEETSVGFLWRLVLEHLTSLPGIGEPLTAGDLTLSQTGQLPHPLGQTSLRKAQWFNLCPMMDPFFKEMVEVMKEITPMWCTWDMHCQGTTCSPLQSCLRVLPTLTSDTFGILWTLTTSQFWRCFKVLPIPSPFQQSPMLPHAPSTPTPCPTPPPMAAPRPPPPLKVTQRPLRIPHPLIQTPL